ncbi:phage tail tape measure protein [Clostridium perfringens]|uniref:phage tail tape measure protein n=1 Tax=Clostridium perfringens TaxID=1502 RepID=UPI0039EB93FE
MADEELLVTLGVQDKGASKQIQALNKELRFLDKEYKTTAKGSKDFEKSQEGLKAKLSNLEKKYDIQKAKLEAYNKKLNESKENINKKKLELEKLKNTEGDNTKAIEKAEKQLQTYKNQMNSATKEISLTEIEMKNLEKEISNTGQALNNIPLEEYKKKIKELDEHHAKVSERFRTIGDNAHKLGDGLLKLSAPVLAIGTASAKMASDFQTAFAKVTTIADENEVSYDKMKKSIIDLSNQTGISASEISNNVYDAISAGQKTGDAVNFVTNSTKLAKAGFAQAGDSLNLLTTILNSYGMEASKVTDVSDKLITTQNIGKTTVAELAQSMGKVIPTAKAFGVNLDNVTTAYAELTAKGIATSEAGTYVSSMFNELGKQGTNASKALKDVSGKTFQELIGSGKSLGDILAIMDEGAKKNKKSLADMFGSAEAGKAAMIIATNSGKDFNNMLSQMKDSAGATQKAFDKMNATPAERMAISVNKIKNEMIRFGENILPMMDQVSNVISKTADWFGKMSEEEQKTIINTTLLTTALGGTLKGFGSAARGAGSLVDIYRKLSKKAAENSKQMKLLSSSADLTTKGVGNLTGGFKLLNPATIAVTASIAAGVEIYRTHSELMNKNILYTTDQMSWLEKAVAKFTGVNAKSKEELIQMGLVYKDFSQNISKEFQEKVIESTAKVNDFNMKLAEINVDGVITKEESEALEGRVTEMADSAINAIKAKQEESNKAMKEFFLRDDVLSENEKVVLESLERISKTNIDEVTKLKNEIFEIEQKALEDKRGLSEEEVNLIKEKRDKIAQIELQSIGKTQEEVLYAQNEFQNRLRSISLEDASKLVEEKAKIRDDEYAKIKTSYDTKIAMLQSNLSQANDIERTAIQEQIDSLTAERDQKLKINDDLYEGYLKTLGEKNPAILAEINKFNGEILSEEDHKSQKMLSKLTEQYEGLKNITESGNYVMVNSTTGAWDAVSVTVDERTGEITGVYDSFHNNVGGYTAAISNEVKEMAKQHKVSAVDVNRALNDMSGTTINASGQIVDANGNIIASLQDVKTNADGTREGVLNLNGTPINVKANTSGAISNLNEVQNKVNNLDGKSFTVTGWIQTKIEQVGKWLGFAKGTNNAPSGTHLVGEEGFEIATKGNKMTLVGLSGPEFRRFSGGEKIIPHSKSVNMLRDVISSGSYFSRNSFESQNLINNINNNYIQNSNINNNFNAESKLEELTDKLVSGIMLAFEKLTLENNVKVGNRELVDIVSNQLAVKSRKR